jgi:hypothetical protein
LTRQRRDDDGRTEDGRTWFEAPEPPPAERIEPTPWVVPTPQLGGSPTAFLNAMRTAMCAGREAGEARARSCTVAAPRRSLRRVF